MGAQNLPSVRLHFRHGNNRVQGFLVSGMQRVAKSTLLSPSQLRPVFGCKRMPLSPETHAEHWKAVASNTRYVVEEELPSAGGTVVKW